MKPPPTILSGAIVFCLSFVMGSVAEAQASKQPVRIAIAGLEHDHAWSFLRLFAGCADVELVGIVETNPELIARFAERRNLPPEIFFKSLDELFEKTRVDAVAAFNRISEHETVVRACAARGIDVMVEKPLAANMAQARAIEAEAKRSGFNVIVNYETTWYPAYTTAYALACEQNKIGAVRKMVFHHGHRGPQEIGCSKYFLSWLTDPMFNGGGALNDFGCYGADLATWFMDGKRPISVFAAKQHIKPDVYPKVEDAATVVLTYPGAEVIIQASWNWPFNRKDMEIYGQTGHVLVPQRNELRVRVSKETADTIVVPEALIGADTDALSYLTDVVRNKIKPTGQAALDVNMIVMEILDAAHRSADSGQVIKF